jgi:hypothetical protein
MQDLTEMLLKVALNTIPPHARFNNKKIDDPSGAPVL